MKICLLSIGILSTAVLHGQSPDEEIRSLIDSAWYYIEVLHKPENALQINEEIILKTKNSDLIWPEALVYQIKAELFRLGKNPDSAAFYHSKAEKLIAQESNQKQLSELYRQQGRYYAKLDMYDDSIELYNKSIAIAKALGDSSQLISALRNRARLNGGADRLLLAMEDYLELLRIQGARKNNSEVAYNLMEIGIIHKKQGHPEQAKKSYYEAIRLFDLINDSNGRAITLVNLALVYKDEKKYTEAYNIFSELIDHFESENNQFGIMACHANMGICSNLLGSFTNAITELEMALGYNAVFKEKAVDADLYNELGKAHLGLGNLSAAESWSLKSREIASQSLSIEKQRDAEKTLSDIYIRMGMYEKALLHYIQYTTLKDSIYEENKAHQILDLQTKYETDKKQKQIEELAESERNQRLQKRIFSGGLIIVILVSFFIIWRETSQRKKARKLHIAEQKLNTLQVERYQEQLQYKQRELTTQALHIAQKQELIQNMKREIEAISNSENFPHNLRPLVNKMSSDEHLDNQWDQFMQNFRETNPAFVDSLLTKHPDLSKSELKLCTLIKMNLDNKDAASILNISDEGIKKARYRLRKKLGLGSDDNLEAVILMQF